ncbi:Alcohol O-acetyltransferase [Handroanthus impetiginosus]|uniref:Alcohol O-acetyltransferase n=1 Tax=Handroanthus impetiginosus TaxID=429701 RepID=A0A2G9I9G8_9LAMI|nr:Alcohol O-acetyltransferase [Handroanthus impetiginosus]
MEIKIKVISQEKIKPSSPTPKSLQKYRLSFLDQIAPPIFMPLVYFYPSDNNFLSPKDQTLDDVQNIGVAVQITRFQYNGIAVGLLTSYKIADALSFFLFADTWAALGRNGNAGDVTPPKFEGPGRRFSLRGISPGLNQVPGLRGKMMKLLRRYLLSPLRKLTNFGKGAPVSSCSGDEGRGIVSFHMDPIRISHGHGAGPKQDSHSAPRSELQNPARATLSEYHLGNISRITIAMPTVRDGSVIDGSHELLQKVREAIRAVNGKYVARLKEGETPLNFIKERMAQAAKGELVSFKFTSLSGMVYENMILQWEMAWINLKENMEKFEGDLELQEFLSQAKETKPFLPPEVKNDEERSSAFELAISHNLNVMISA